MWITVSELVKYIVYRCAYNNFSSLGFAWETMTGTFPSGFKSVSCLLTTNYFIWTPPVIYVSFFFFSPIVQQDLKELPYLRGNRAKIYNYKLCFQLRSCHLCLLTIITDQKERKVCNWVVNSQPDCRSCDNDTMCVYVCVCVCVGVGACVCACVCVCYLSSYLH